MPGFYNSTQVRYFKEMEQKQDRKNAKKEEYLNNIRTRAYEKTNIEIGQSRKVVIKGVPEGLVAGNPGFDANMEGVGALFEVWAPGTGLSNEPVKDKHHININKMATR